MHDRTLLSTHTILKPWEEEREEIINLKQKQDHYYNRSAQVLPEVQPSTKEYV